MGTGTIATEHMVEAIRSAGHDALWVVSRNREYAKAFSEDMMIPRTAVQAKHALNDPLVDFVYVSAHRDRRKHYISTAAEARKHVLCDGPISDSSRVARALADKCRDAGISLAMNQPLRASTIHQTMRRLLMEGDIGELQSLLIVRAAPFHAPPNRRNDEEVDNGNLLLDYSVENIDLARFLTGQNPIEVATLMTAPNGGANQQLSYAMRMSGGVMFNAYESFTTADIESLVMLAGDHGALIAHGTLNGKSSGTLVRRVNSRNELMPVRERDAHRMTIEGFLGLIRRPSSWMCQGDDMIAALVAAEAVKTAGEKRRTIAIDAPN